MQVLYEIALAFGSLMEPFCIYTLRPRTRVPHDGVITDIGEPPLVLVVEDSSDGPDLECIASHEVRLFGVHVTTDYCRYTISNYTLL